MQKKQDGAIRRAAILTILQKADAPVSGTALAKELQVSRQVIVQDIALLRASDCPVLSTPRGYMLPDAASSVHTRRFSVSHRQEDMEEELNLFVDAGARVLDVVVKHPVYGEIRGNLNLKSRRDVTAFLKRLQTQKGVPLLEISGGLHQHTLEAESEKILDEIGEALKSRGFLR